MVRGRKRDLVKAHKVEADLSASIHNRFDLEVIDVRTGKVRQRACAENVICNQLWTRLLAGYVYFSYIHYGTGSGTPSSADTALFSFLGCGTVAEATESLDLPGCAYALRKQIQLSETAAVGESLTEVGIAYGTAANSLCTHAMLQDMNGNQISIQKTNTDIINIYATVFVHWPEEYYRGGIQFCASTGGFLLSLAGGGYSIYSPQYAQLTIGRRLYSGSYHVGQSGQNEYAYVSSTRQVNVESKTMTFTYERFPIAAGNWALGAHGVAIFCYASGSNSKTPEYPAFWLDTSGDWFPGTVVSGEAVGTGDGETKDFATAFDLPTNATVYVDGVAAPEVTVESVPLGASEMARYLHCVTVENGVAYPSLNKDALYPGTYYNPYWRYGLRTVECYAYYYSAIKLEASDDLIHWSEVYYSDRVGGTVTIPEELRYSKYFKFSSGNSSSWFSPIDAVSLTGKNIHFQTPPPAGAVITADYTTKCIAKDESHVFDLTVTIHFGEYRA